MKENKGKTRGIPAIARANAMDLIVFGAVSYARSVDENADVTDTIKNVTRHFGIQNVDIETLRLSYYRTQKIFLDND